MIIYSQKYYTKYNQIIKHYKELDLKKSGEQYTESHHILPKSMGGSDKKDNLVRVPARVHFLLHWMLYRIYKTPGMAFAWNYMTMNNGHRQTSASYSYARKTQALENSISHKGFKMPEEAKARISSTLMGTHRTEETKTKISLSKTGKPNGKEGVPHTKSHKINISAALKNKPQVQCTHCYKIGHFSPMMRWHFDNCRLKS